MAQENYSLDVGATIRKQTKTEEDLKKLEKEHEKKAEEKETKEEKHHHKKEEKTWAQKHEIIFIIILLAIIVSAGTYLRVFSLNAPAIEELVDRTFEDSLRTAVAQNIEKEHVGALDPVFLQEETEKQLKKLLKHPDTIKEKESLVEEYKQVYFDKDDNPYLIGFDPYLYLRYARNILRHGHVGETTKDGKYSLETVACIGACGLAPAMVINKKTYGKLTPKKVVEILDELASKSKGEN